MDEIMTVKEVAEYLKLHHMTVYKLVQKGKIPATKVGGSWRFKKEIIDKWLKSNQGDLELVRTQKRQVTTIKEVPRWRQ